MKLRKKPERTSEGSSITSHTDAAGKQLANLIGDNFSARVQNHRSEGKQLSRNGHMKSFGEGENKFIAIVGENKPDKSGSNMPDDIKARYGAILEGYKMIADHITSSYLPDQPPYEIRYPKALAYEHKDEGDILIIEWIDGLVSLEDLNYGVKIPNEHIKPINRFLDDRDDAIDELSTKSGIRKDSKSNRSKYRQFIVNMPYGDVVVESDFGMRLNGNGQQVETLYNCGYILGKQANEKPVIYLTDGLVSSSMKPKTK